MKRSIKPRTAIFQRSEIFKEAVTTGGLSAIAFLASWLTLFTTKTIKNFWETGFIWCLGSLGLSLFALWITRRLQLRRAYPFHLLIGAMYFVSAFPFLDASYRLAFPTSVKINWMVFALMLLIAVSGLITRSAFIYFRLQKARRFNQASRRLNEQRGEWNVAEPMRLDTPEATQAYQRRWKARLGLLPFVTGLTTFILQRAGMQASVLIPVICFSMFGYLLIWIGAGNQIGIAVRLLKWEREWDKPILLPVGTN